MSAGEWVGFGWLYLCIGLLVMMGIVALDDLLFAHPRLFVGLVLFWPLALVAVLCRCAKSVWRWGFGRKEK